MNKATSHLQHQATYGPLSAKTLHTILRRELMEQFGFEQMGLIADTLIKRFLDILDAYSPERVRLLPGQVLWLAVAKDERHAPGKTMLKTRLVPVKLTLIATADLEAYANSRQVPRDRHGEIAARLLREAYEQGGVLSFPDVGVLLGLSARRAAAIVHEYEQEHGVYLPYRGTVHDMGRTTTHKVQAIRWKLQGMLTREIARRIQHDPKSVDIYQTDFERVYELHCEGKRPEQIAFLIKRSRQLVEEYIKLIDEHVDDGAERADGPARSAKKKDRRSNRDGEGEKP